MDLLKANRRIHGILHTLQKPQPFEHLDQFFPLGKLKLVGELYRLIYCRIGTALMVVWGEHEWLCSESTLAEGPHVGYLVEEQKLVHKPCANVEEWEWQTEWMAGQVIQYVVLTSCVCIHVIVHGC